ncbi:conserved hypothetical protein, partial [Streptomyces sp. Mg1]
GSSPRVRGAGPLRRVREPSDGVIPAGAGSSQACPAPSPCWGVIPAGAGSSGRQRFGRRAAGGHPRGCGEQPIRPRTSKGVMGSSPRVRGAAWASATEGVPTRGHPRGCGEQFSLTSANVFGCGSSPRVRGADTGPGLRHATAGVIPAGAGSSRRCGPGDTSGWGHPRGCGEQDFDFGVSPALVGVIPAGAGSRCRTGLSDPAHRGHPRGCGEQRSRPQADERREGSSPRVRGAGPRRAGRRPHRGVIPAGAGSSCHWSRVRSAHGGHPRGCGEQLARRAAGRGRGGSSPRVRGADPALRGGLAALGVIPAGAGSSSFAAGFVVHGRGHPRGCGEQPGSYRRPAGSGGSSPRVRGAGTPAWCGGWRRGVIPAGAGSSSPVLLALLAEVGSSPRVRGAGWAQERRAVVRGVIPAGAGSSGGGGLMATPEKGSSPRVRGAVFSHCRAGLFGGVIPAGAGSSKSGGTVRRQRGHPRGCGEQPPPAWLPALCSGSSPRVRGAGLRPPGSGRGRGVIPAGAG